MVDFFLIKSLDYKSNIKNRITKKITQKRGATLQKLSQMMIDEENRSLIHHKPTSIKVLSLLESYSPTLFKDTLSISENFYQGSIGNIHKVNTRSGESLAIKTLREGILGSIQKDLSYSDKLISSTSNFIESDKFENMDKFTQSFIKGITEECNLESELDNYRNYKINFTDYKYINLAETNEEQSNDKVLISKWIETTLRIEDLSTLSRKILNNYAMELCDLFFLKPFVTGYIQEDTNLSNFIISNERLYIIDYGKISFLPLSMRISLAKLIEVTYKNDNFNYLELYARIGFDKDLLEPIEHLLPNISEILLAPLLSDDYFDFNKWDPVSKINTICGDLKWNFRASAPMSYFTLVRSYFGFLKFMKRLDSAVAFKEIREKIINYLQPYLTQYEVPESPRTNINILTGKKLNIIVRRGNEERVNLKLPAHVLYNINNYLSTNILKELEKRNQNIQELIQLALKNNSDDILYLEEGNDSFSVRLIS